MTEVALRYPFNALVSFHYYQRDDLTRLTSIGLRLIGDSGAFSALSQGATIDVDAFGEWATRWRRQLCWVASLDVIGDPDATWRNYQRLRTKHELDVVPTLHAGNDKRVLDRYVAEGIDFMGLGGLVPHRGRPLATMPWLVDVFRYARDKHPQLRFHGWGVTSPRLTMALPWYSVDSSNIGGAYRYARLVAFDPASGRWHQIDLDGSTPHRYDDLLRRAYGVRASEVLTSVPANRRLLIRMGGRSYQLVEDYLRKRHGVVSAPHYGLQDSSPGLAMHAVQNSHGKTDGLPDLGHDGLHMHAVTRGHKSADNQMLGNQGPELHAVDGSMDNLLRLGQ